MVYHNVFRLDRVGRFKDNRIVAVKGFCKKLAYDEFRRHMGDDEAGDQYRSWTVGKDQYDNALKRGFPVARPYV